MSEVVLRNAEQAKGGQRPVFCALLALVPCAALLTACKHEPVNGPGTYASTAPARPQPEPTASPAVNGAPRFTGLAAYYSDSLAGNRTANGDRYNPKALTAAHRTLPFGTELRVTRVDTQRSVIVRVNDRGPFGDNRRVIDLSRRAAEQLGMIRAGVVQVEIEVLGRLHFIDH
jgi:rare lipoprotein A